MAELEDVLTTNEFTRLTSWAGKYGYTYQGVEIRSGFAFYIFFCEDDATALVPVSSDTADEAINALIGTIATYRETIEMAKQVVDDARREAYDAGFTAGTTAQLGDF